MSESKDPLDRWYTLAERLVVALEKLAPPPAMSTETVEPLAWTITLQPVTVNKISVIKTLCELTCLSVTEAKKVSEGIPLHGLSKELADEIRVELDNCTTVKIQPSLNPLDVHLDSVHPHL